MSRKEYDSMSRLVKVTEFIYGSVTEYAYDTWGDLISETVKEDDAVLAQTLYAYNNAAESGAYRAITTTIVGDEAAPSIVTTEYLDKCSNLVKTGRF